MINNFLMTDLKSKSLNIVGNNFSKAKMFFSTNLPKIKKLLTEDEPEGPVVEEKSTEIVKESLLQEKQVEPEVIEIVEITEVNEEVKISETNELEMTINSVQDKFNSELALGAFASVVNLVNLLIERASELGASDIHIDPQPKAVRVRLRIDGVLQDLAPLPTEIYQEVISRIKILAGLRTDEHQAAQDGRFRISFREYTETPLHIDIRVSIAPTYHGENAVLRLLSDQAEDFTLETMGFSKIDQDRILRAAKRPHGMILVTGPTGSGKTTTLYTLVKLLNTPQVSIITIEDPIEYAVIGVEQIQVNARTELTFANGLRSILRQDPNIIMVGEIRDRETAGIAVNTALTGRHYFT
jgi:type II secretory ATPase GspE/PulE/Tfp pilus assembly ATPase PilB-like protein